MDRILARLERRLGRYAITGLPAIIVGGMGIVFLLAYTRPEFLGLLTFSPRAIAQGQVWRLFSYLFIPPDLSLLWVLFNLYWVWMVGSNLEAEWGAFKLNVYYFLGMLGTTAAAFIAGDAEGNLFLNLSLFFAFATLFPDYEILVFFILPVRMKWLGWASLAFVGFELVVSPWAARAAIVASLSNYLLFFAGDIARILGGRRTLARQAARRASSAPPPAASASRVCAICNAREADGADIRVCSCDKCKAATGGTTRALCLEHARNH